MTTSAAAVPSRIPVTSTPTSAATRPEPSNSRHPTKSTRSPSSGVARRVPPRHRCRSTTPTLRFVKPTPSLVPTRSSTVAVKTAIRRLPLPPQQSTVRRDGQHPACRCDLRVAQLECFQQRHDACPDEHSDRVEDPGEAGNAIRLNITRPNNTNATVTSVSGTTINLQIGGTGGPPLDPPPRQPKRSSTRSTITKMCAGWSPR